MEQIKKSDSQTIPCQNKSFTVAHYNKDLAYPSTGQNRSYGTTIASSRLQTDRDSYRFQQSNTHLRNTAKSQRDQPSLCKSMFDARAAEVGAASTEGCITLDDPIALFGAYYMQSDWYRALQSRPLSMYSDLARKLFNDSKPVPETGRIIIPTKYKTIFDDHDSRSFFPRHPEDSSRSALSKNRGDAQQSSKIHQPQQGCFHGAIRKNGLELLPKYSDDQMTVEKESYTTNATIESKEDQSLNPNVLSPSKEIGKDIGRQENTFGEELIKTESFLQEEFGLQVKEEVPWW